MNKQTNQTFISQFVTGFEFKKKKIMKYSFLMLKLLYISIQKKKKVIIYIRTFLSK